MCAVRAHSEWTHRTGVVWRREDGPEADASLTVEPITIEDLDEVCAIDTELLRRDLEARPISDRVRFAITADAACLRMRISGAQYTQTRVRGQSSLRSAHVSATTAICSGRYVGVDWPRSVPQLRLGEGSMIVLRTRAESPRHMRTLLAAVGDEAEWQGCRRIRALGLEDLEGTGLAATPVTDRFPGVCWLDDAPPSGELDWIACDSAASCSFS